MTTENKCLRVRFSIESRSTAIHIRIVAKIAKLLSAWRRLEEGKMTETIRKVDYFCIETPNKPGEGARALVAFSNAGVNFLAFSGFPLGRRAQMDFIPEDTAAFKIAARKAGLKLSPKKTGFLVQGEDRPGVIAGIMSALAVAGVNVTAIDAIAAGKGRYGAIFWVKPPDVRKAAKALGI
jgi:hypothetical protein